MAAPIKPPAIDASEFARKGLEIHGTIALSQFPRLYDVLASPDGALEFRLLGRVDSQGRPRMHLQLQGQINLICQRCMEPLQFMVDVDTDFLLVSDEGMIPAAETEDEMEEYLVADAELDVSALLEDELLLALPFAPKHEEACAEKAGLRMQTEKQSPFDVLKGLKTRGQD